MEYGLRGKAMRPVEKTDTVLILVLIEYGLREPDSYEEVDEL